MRPVPVLLLVLGLASIALAGCLGSGSGSDTPVTPTDNGGAGAPGVKNVTLPSNGTQAATNATGPVVKTFSGHAAGVGVPGMFAVQTPTVDDHNFAFDVANGSSGVVAEVAWNGSDALLVYLYPPCDDAGAAGTGVGASCPSTLANEQGKSPAKIMATDLSKLKNGGAGKWTVQVFAQQNPTGVAFHAASSVFYGEAPKDSYTALHG